MSLSLPGLLILWFVLNSGMSLSLVMYVIAWFVLRGVVYAAALMYDFARDRQHLARERAAFAACFPKTFGHQQTRVHSKGKRGDALAWRVAFMAFAVILVLASLHG
jgi:hypothetical protein